MQNWRTINAQRRRYINYNNMLLSAALRRIRLEYTDKLKLLSSKDLKEAYNAYQYKDAVNKILEIDSFLENKNDYHTYNEANDEEKFIIVKSQTVIKEYYLSIANSYIAYANKNISFLSLSDIHQTIENAFIEMYQITGVAFAKTAVATLQKAMKIQIKAADPEILESEWLRFMADFVRERCGVKIQSITRNIFKDIESITKSVVTEGSPQGWGPAKVADEIFKRVGQRDHWRAMRIARTEVVGASNAGSYKGAGSFGIKLKKIWLVNMDDRTRDDHREMNTAPHVAYSDEWQVGNDKMLYPGDPKASPENVINCRCALTYEPEQNIIDDILSNRFNPDNPEIY